MIESAELEAMLDDVRRLRHRLSDLEETLSRLEVIAFWLGALSGGAVGLAVAAAFLR